MSPVERQSVYSWERRGGEKEESGPFQGESRSGEGEGGQKRDVAFCSSVDDTTL